MFSFLRNVYLRFQRDSNVRSSVIVKFLETRLFARTKFEFALPMTIWWKIDALKSVLLSNIWLLFIYFLFIFFLFLKQTRNEISQLTYEDLKDPCFQFHFHFYFHFHLHFTLFYFILPFPIRNIYSRNVLMRDLYIYK